MLLSLAIGSLGRHLAPLRLASVGCGGGMNSEHVTCGGAERVAREPRCQEQQGFGKATSRACGAQLCLTDQRRVMVRLTPRSQALAKAMAPENRSPVPETGGATGCRPCGRALRGTGRVDRSPGQQRCRLAGRLRACDLFRHSRSPPQESPAYHPRCRLDRTPSGALLRHASKNHRLRAASLNCACPAPAWARCWPARCPRWQRGCVRCAPWRR